MYHFTGNVNDDSGNGYTLTNNGATLTTDKNGVSNQAYSFNGTSNYMTTTGANLVSPGTSSFSIAIWIYANNIAANARFAAMRNVGNTGAFWEFQIYTDSKIYFNAYDGTNTTQVSSVALSSTTWYHVIGEVDREASKVRLYINGALAQETALTATNSLSNTTFAIGAYPNNSNWFGGKIDEFRYYNRILTQYEKNQLYYGYDTTKNQYGILRKGLLAEYHFSGNVTDSSGNSYDLTNNGASLTTDKNAVSNQAYSFNGSSNYMTRATVSKGIVWSISMWINTSSLAGTYYISFDGGTAYVDAFAISSSGITVRIAGSASSFSLSDTIVATGFSTSTWYHVCFTRDGDTFKCYVDGVLRSTTTGAGTYNLGSTTMEIGVYRYSGGSRLGYFSGTIDEVKIYSRVISDTEVKMLAQGYDTTSTSVETLTRNLTAKYSYTGNTNDTSGNGYTLTNNSCTLTTDKNAVSNQAYAFSGSAQYMNTATDLLASKSAITMTGWAKSSVWATAPGGALWLKNGASATNDTGFAFSATTAYAIIRTASSNYGSYAFSLTNNNWYFFAMTFNGNLTTNATRLQMFIDKLYRTMSYTGTIPATTSSTSAASTIGRWEQQATYFNGTIDEVRLYDTYLTQDELLELNYSYDVPAMLEDVSGYSKTINGISSYANVNGVAKANISKVNGI